MIVVCHVYAHIAPAPPRYTMQLGADPASKERTNLTQGHGQHPALPVCNATVVVFDIEACCWVGRREPTREVGCVLASATGSVIVKPCCSAKIVIMLTQDSFAICIEAAPQGCHVNAVFIVALNNAISFQVITFTDSVLYTKVVVKPDEIGPRRFMDVAPQGRCDPDQNCK